jgi:hypothetical protein
MSFTYKITSFIKCIYVCIHNAIDVYGHVNYKTQKMPWRRGLVVSSPQATEETGAMGRAIESRQGIGW